jgi:pimeloyl-ACP methyl ester carboxylesterase
VATAGAVAGLAVATAGGAYLVHRARSRPDPDRGLDLAERPGEEVRVASFDGTELAVRVVGPREAPVVVFAHGFTLDLTAWHFQWRELSKVFRCVLYDHRGHGESSPAVGGDYSLDALARDLKAVVDRTAGSAPVVLVGHSLGGMAVLSFAALHPEEFGTRVRAVVLANTSAGDVLKAMLGAAGARVGASVLPWVRRMAGNPARLYRLRAVALGRSSALAFLAARVTNFGAGASPSVIEHVVRLAARAPAEVWTDLFVSLIDLDLRHALERVAVPTLVLASDLDRLTPPASALAMKHSLPDARMVVLRGAGHCAMLERHEQFNGALVDFLREVLLVGAAPVRAAPQRVP